MFQQMRRDPWVLVGLVAFLGLVFVALFGERIAPHESIYFVPTHDGDPRPYDPGLVFPFGSDVLGRDIFSLVLAGARATLTIVLLAGVARVAGGAIVAAITRVSAPTRLAAESAAELVSAIPATLVALVLVKVLVKTGDANIALFIGALLLTGWAGPYRVIRAELDRLSVMPFTQGAKALGVGRWRLLWRHHLPHLVPAVAINLSQQVVASLVLIAELGVLGVFVGATRFISIEESLSIVLPTQVNGAQISEPPEWGGLLANARTIESLWTTRWLFLVPGVAFGITAIAVAAVGFALARRYARRDVSDDLRGRATAALGVAVLALVVLAAVVPERYAAAREWATAARAEVRPVSDVEAAFRDAGLRPFGASYGVQRDIKDVLQSGPATVRIGSTTATEGWPRKSSDLGKLQVRSFVHAGTGGGAVDAPLVFAARGISPSDYPPGPPRPPIFLDIPDLGKALQDYADDYAGIDVRGKVVLMVRFVGVCPARGIRTCSLLTRGYTTGPLVEDAVANAVKRGAAAILFVDPSLTAYVDTVPSGFLRTRAGFEGGINPYKAVEDRARPTGTTGVPVVVLGPEEAARLVAPVGLDLSPFIALDQAGSDVTKHSAARDLGVTARVEVPLAATSGSVTSFVGEVAGVPTGTGRILVWASRGAGGSHPPTDVLAALARSLGARNAPFIFVDFDPSVDASANAKTIAGVLKDRRIALVVVLGRLDGGALRFTTPHGDLIPALDLYAEKAGASHEPTRTTAPVSALGDNAPFIEVKTVLVSGGDGAGDLRPDAAAVVGYLAGRLALGAEEAPR
jgi:ABC-type dipeptide/oligopeptide/nickel transport system permease subunit